MKHYHSLRKTKEFQQVYRTGKSKANKYFVLYCMENQLGYNRFGISVSKKRGKTPGDQTSEGELPAPSIGAEARI